MVYLINALVVIETVFFDSRMVKKLSIRFQYFLKIK